MENQDPQDIGKINIANIIIWMKKEGLRTNNHPKSK